MYISCAYPLINSQSGPLNFPCLGFRDYYATLYNLDFDQTPDAQAAKLTAIQAYMTASGLPPLTDEQCSTLESPITPTEIESMVKTLPNGKSPGPDRFSKAYYRSFLPLLSESMCGYFNSIAEGTAIPTEALLAHISVIPKDGKDPTMPQGYRPISPL